MKRAIWICALAAAAYAQDAAADRKFSISGVVKNSVNGQPLADYNVSTSLNVTYNGDVVNQTAQTRQLQVTTDQQGRYTLSGLPAGEYRLNTISPRGFIDGITTRHAVIGGGDLERFDFAVVLSGKITGRVVDENREPVPGVWVKLVSREYYSGVLGHFFKGMAKTDDRGAYTLDRVASGQAFLVMADSGVTRMSPRSDAPLDPKLRRRTAMRTFYPNSPDKEGASAVIVRPGETREGVDIEVKKSPSYCVEGTASGMSGPAALNVTYEGAQPAFGTTSTGGMFGVGPSTTTGSDGKFRFCGLSPGQYRLGASDGFQGTVNRAMLPIEIRDKDLTGVNLTVGPGMTLQGEVVWDGAAPAKPATAKVNLTLNPLLRAPVANERAFARADLPGTFSIAAVLPSDHAIRALVNGPGLYIKDVEYAGQSALYAPLRVGSAIGDARLRVIVGQDGGTVSARVQDKDGNPLPDMRVVVMPAEVSSEGMLQAAMVTGQTNQLGQYKSQYLRPGKYLAMAMEERVDASPESITALWRARTRFQEVEVAPGGSASVTLKVGSIR